VLYIINVVAMSRIGVMLRTFGLCEVLTYAPVCRFLDLANLDKLFTVLCPCRQTGYLVHARRWLVRSLRRWCLTDFSVTGL